MDRPNHATIEPLHALNLHKREIPKEELPTVILVIRRLLVCGLPIEVHNYILDYMSPVCIYWEILNKARFVHGCNRLPFLRKELGGPQAFQTYQKLEAYLSDIQMKYASGATFEFHTPDTHKIILRISNPRSYSPLSQKQKDDTNLLRRCIKVHVEELPGYFQFLMTMLSTGVVCKMNEHFEYVVV